MPPETRSVTTSVIRRPVVGFIGGVVVLIAVAAIVFFGWKSGWFERAVSNANGTLIMFSYVPYLSEGKIISHGPLSYDIETAALTPIATPEDLYIQYAMLSAQANRILAIVQSPDTGAQHLSVFTYPSFEERAVTETNADRGYLTAVWSPDGETFAYTSFSLAAMTNQTVDADGTLRVSGDPSASRVMLDTPTAPPVDIGSGLALAVSPDGQKVLVGQSNAFAMLSSSGEVMPVSLLGGMEVPQQSVVVQVSSDATHILYTTGERLLIGTIDWAAATITKQTELTGGTLTAAFGPENQIVVLVSDGTTHFYRLIDKRLELVSSGAMQIPFPSRIIGWVP